MPRKKHFLIGSANPVNRGFLAQIKNERRAIDTALNKKPELVHLISKPDLSFEELVDGFMDNEEIEFFHYCGHSSEIGVTLEASPTQGETVTKERFCNFLSSQKNLKIAFLNSCTSTSIGQELIKRGTVEVVIETVKPIYDEAAALFAKLFYGYLIKGESIKEAFNQSISVLEDPTKEKQENKRGDGFDDDTGSSTFPWRLYPSIADEQHLVNSWRLFTSIEGTLKTHKGPKLLCVYPPYKEYSRYFNGYFDDVKAVLNSPDFIDSKDEKDSIFVCDFESVRAENASLIERFDCLLFFVNAKFNEFWSTEKEYFRGSLGKLKVGLLRCKGSLHHCKELLGIEHLSDGEQLHLIEIPDINYSIDRLSSADESRVEAISEFNYLLKDLVRPKKQLGKKEISRILGESLIDLNFSEQNDMLDEDEDIQSNKFNFFLIEGTKDCAHEVLIRRIYCSTYDLDIEHASTLPYPISIENNFDPDKRLSVDDVSAVIASEVLKNRMLYKTPERLFAGIIDKIEKQNLIILIGDLESNQHALNAFYEFWTSFKVYFEEKRPSRALKNLFIFALNKGYSDKCSFHKSRVFDLTSYPFGTFPMPPISTLSRKQFNSWTRKGSVQRLKEDQRFVHIKRNLWKSLSKENNREVSRIALRPVISTICSEMGCQEIFTKIMTIGKPGTTN